MAVIFWIVVGFMLGAIPFSPLIGRLVLGQDITRYGDKNPGATNVLRAGGFFWFTLALALDISKGALPVGLAYQVYGWQGWEAILIAVAPVAGHAFSPFLQGKGGKAIAAAFGTWIGLTLWQIPLVSMLLLILWSLLIKPSGWAVLITLFLLLPVIWFWLGDGVLVGAMVAQIGVLLIKQHEELRVRPQLRRK
ncbi:MAG: glycerol-3-phosphate acyltransferase [Chloroflexi bacterium]|nr:glycerol-3-phosphate acyltransferase [Chloroflexota bacterium]